jgi:hypothetical protein
VYHPTLGWRVKKKKRKKQVIPDTTDPVTKASIQEIIVSEPSS